jgi:hypothetical protein
LPFGTANNESKIADFRGKVPHAAATRSLLQSYIPFPLNVLGVAASTA